MNEQAVASTKKRLQRKAIVTTALCLFWAGSMVAISGQRIAGLRSDTYLSAALAVFIIWAVNTYRTVRRIRNRDYLEQAAIAANDERNIQNTYQATRLAAVIVMCAAPVAICALTFFDMQQAIDTIAATLVLFMLVYLVSWFYISRKN